MNTLNLRRFCQPDVLAAICPELLHAFLKPFAACFEGHVKLDDLLAPDTAPEACEKVSELLALPGPHMAPGLVEALFRVNEMATEEGREALLEAAAEAGLQVPAESTAAEVALRVWLAQPGLLTMRHDEARLGRVRSFEYFAGSGDLPMREPSAEILKSMETDIGAWFQRRNSTDVARIRVYPSEREVWFLITHGEGYCRQPVLENRDFTHAAFYPAKSDIVVYDRTRDQLRISSQTRRVKELYRTTFGFYLFGREGYFPALTRRYTLEPLRLDGARALTCCDVAGLESVRLRILKVACRVSGETVFQTLTADDLLPCLSRMGGVLTMGTEVLKASFAVKFNEAVKPRIVTVKPPNVLQLTRREDASVIEDWMERRGFASASGAHGDEQRELVLEVS